MCILFIKTLLNPESDEYYLILANVRDEYYSRPTQICSFWDNHNQIIGPKDLMKGKEGGTWIAMNRNGKIGVLLNILEPHNEMSVHKKPRGFIVVDYLKGNHSPQSFLQEISSDTTNYNGFQMIALHIKPNGSTENAFLSSLEHEEHVQSSSGMYAFGNNETPEHLWPKVNEGKVKFEALINKYSKTKYKSQLIDGIFELLSDKTIYPLDNQMKKQGKGIAINILEKYNAINVEIPEIEYGSRTWSIILVDAQLNVDYIEKTMKEPINLNHNIEWITTKNHFKIEK